MKKIFSKKTVAITAVTIFMVSLFAWGLVVGQGDYDEGSTEASIEISSIFSISVAPTSFAFSHENDVGAGLYGGSATIDAGSGGAGAEIYADEVVDVTVEAPNSFSVIVTSEDLVNEDDPETGGTPDWPVIPASEVECEDDAVPGYVEVSAGERIIQKNNASGAGNDGSPETFNLNFRLFELPEDLRDGSHKGDLTFDLNTF